MMIPNGNGYDKVVNLTNGLFRDDAEDSLLETEHEQETVLH